MASFESVAVPMHYLEDGRPFISDETLCDQPEVLEFVRRFPDYWVRADDLCLCGVVGPKPEPEDDA